MSLLGMMQGLNEAGVEFVVIGGVAARAHGSVRVTEDLDICYSRQAENLDRLARLLAGWHAYPRGIEAGLPFIMDRKTLDRTMILTLSTDQGELDLLDRVEGIGDFAAVRRAAVRVEAAGALSFWALGLEGLLKAKRATKRRKDLDQLPELEALLQLRKGLE